MLKYAKDFAQVPIKGLTRSTRGEAMLKEAHALKENGR